MATPDWGSAVLHNVPAPAKLNLFLHVVGRRQDGYHLLESVFVLIDWTDTLHFERRADGQLQRHDLSTPLPETDLCLKAAQALQQASGCPWGVDMAIDKQVPSGAGMGGGSSDAATVLLALNRMWDLRWPRQRLLKLAATLGADVPFFVGGHNAFVQGIGDELTPVAVPVQGFAVIKPQAGLGTADIFGSPELKRDSASAIIMGSLESDVMSALIAGGGHNDLQPVAEARCAEVAQAAQWLEQRFGKSRMTGSGSAVFSRVGNAEPPMATWPAEQLPQGWVGRWCRSLPEHPLLGWAD
jgi:4-diphosphocytidyl-2-C-methyl-D-erythritol kinase